MAITTVHTELIAADAVTGAKIADDAIDSEHYTNASIDNAHLADDAVDSAELAAGAVDLAHMSVNSIDSDQYIDGSIDLAHMSVNSIDSNQYVDGSIDTAHLAADAVTGAKIADDAIDSEHYTDGSIDVAHMSANSIDSAQYVDGSIDLAHMSVNSIDSDQYVDGSIDTAHIADDAVTGAKIENSPTIASNLAVGGTLGVTGATTLSAGVGVTGTATASAFTDSYITWSLAQMNRYGGDIELQYTPTNTSTRVRIGANGSNPTVFNAHSGNVTIAGTLGVAGTTTLTGNLTMMSNTLYANQAYVHDRLGHLNDADTYIDFGVDTITFAAGGERMRIASAGQLGIGGANYGTDGQVLTSTGASSAPAWEDAGGGGASLSGSTNNTVTTVTGSDAIQGEANLTFLTNCLGIGVATETWASDVDVIQVGGLGALFSKSSQSANQHTNLSNNCYDDVSTGQSFIVSDCASKITLVDDHMAFHVSAEGTADNAISFMEIARITNYSPGGGNMCVGTTASVGASNGKFFVNNGGGGGIISNVTGGSPLYLWRRDSGASTAQVYITFWTSGGNDGGNIKTNDSGELTVNQASDYRIKENVVSIGSATEKVKQLNPIKFNIIGFPDLPRQGFLAHEVQEIVPQAVHGEKDAVDDDGEMIIQDMDVTKLIPIMVKTIQELEARIATLEVE